MVQRLDPAAVLARFGLAPGPAGWSLRDLVDLALKAGYSAVVEPEARPTPAHRFRGLVFRPPDPRATGAPYSTRAARRRGPTEVSAPAAALAAALGREPATAGGGRAAR